MALKFKSKLIDDKKLFQRFTKSVRRIPRNLSVDAGFLGESALEIYPRSGATVAEVAAWNENGTETSPKRPFMSTAIDNNLKRINRMQKYSVIKLLFTGRGSAESELSKRGVFIRDAIKDSIIKWSTPPNAPSTIARKGFNDPLIETKKMLNAVTYSLNKGGL